MPDEQGRAALVSEVKSVINAVMPGATMMDLPSVISSEAVAITAFDASDTRPADALADAFVARLRSDGWVIDDRQRHDPEPTFHAAKAELGGGAFAVQTTAVSFNGVIDHG